MDRFYCRDSKGKFTKNYIAMESMEFHTRNALVILQAMQNGQRLTTQICFRLFHTTELRQYVSRLKRWGHDIRSEWTTNEKGQRFKEYFLVV